MAAISNCKISEVHKMQFEITIANMPRYHSSCARSKHRLYIFYDNNFFLFKTIHFEILYNIPTIRKHDKQGYIKPAYNALICHHICATSMLFKL